MAMRRRAFIAALGGAVAWPVVALTGATAAKSFTIGYLALLPDEDRMSFMARFMRRLAELDYNDGQNLRLVYRSAEGQPDILPRRASELVAMKPPGSSKASPDLAQTSQAYRILQRIYKGTGFSSCSRSSPALLSWRCC
jgi:hypothetical protein